MLSGWFSTGERVWQLPKGSLPACSQEMIMVAQKKSNNQSMLAKGVCREIVLSFVVRPVRRTDRNCDCKGKRRKKYGNSG
jgi:hypothetical protein